MLLLRKIQVLDSDIDRIYGGGGALVPKRSPVRLDRLSDGVRRKRSDLMGDSELWRWNILVS